MKKEPDALKDIQKFLDAYEKSLENKARLEAEPKKRTPRTTSHIIVYTFLIIYVVVAIWAAIIITILVFKFPEVTVQLMISYLTYISACGAVIAFYLNKAKAENERKIANAKNAFRLDMAQDIFELIRTNKLDAESVSLLKVLISDNETQLTYPGGGYMPGVIDQSICNSPINPSMNQITNQGG